MPEEPTEKPKLIIDDDWKERVQSEKEAAAAEAAAKSNDTEPTAETTEKDADAAVPVEDQAAEPDAAASAGDEAPPEGSQDLPPASFATLVHSLTAQALSSLGQIPDPEGKINVDIAIGKHFIDTLAVLEEKTKGNLDADESNALSKMLHELRMLFVHVRKEQQQGPAEEASNE